MAKVNSQIIEGIQKYFLIGMLGLFIFLLFLFISPFLSTLFLAAIIAIAIYPLYRFGREQLKIPKTLAVVITLIFVVIVLQGLITWFSISIVGQAADAYSTISHRINEFSGQEYTLLSMLDRFPTVQGWIQDLLKNNPISLKEIISTAGDFVGAISGFLLGQTTNVLKHLSVFVLHALVFVLALFFFVRDGKGIVTYTKSLLPLKEKYRNELFVKIHKLMKAIFFGIFGTALLQGLLVGIGLAIVGVENAAFWGAVAALLSPIPYIGTSIVWVPVVITLFVTGAWGWGIFLGIWGTVIVGLSDNIIKPILIGSTTSLHPLMVMLVVLGGVFAFGFKGLIFGPLILMLALGFLHIYELEYRDVLQTKKK